MPGRLPPVEHRSSSRNAVQDYLDGLLCVHRVLRHRTTERAQAPGRQAMKTYIVKSGDTLSGIARRFGIALTELLRANRQIADPNRIFPGQRINIPGDESRAEQDRTVACPVNRPPTASDSA